MDAQQEKVRKFVEGNGEVIGEFTDTASGKSSEREGLSEAIRVAKKRKATVLVARLDRFSRRVSFISRLMEQKVELCVVDMPNATTFQLHIYAAMAEEERRLISIRTKEALKQAKERGVELGVHSKILAPENHDKAKVFAEEVLGLINCYRRDGVGYTEIARQLNEMGVKSYRDKKFYPSPSVIWWDMLMLRNIRFKYAGV